MMMALVVLVGCTGSGKGSGENGDDGSGVPTEPVVLDSTEFTYTLSESVDGLPLWTTPCTHKVLSNERAPAAEASGLRLFAAKGELEPAQLIAGPASGSISVTATPFSSLGGDQRISIFRAEYDSGFAERLIPLDAGEQVALGDDAGIPIWIDHPFERVYYI